MRVLRPGARWTLLGLGVLLLGAATATVKMSESGEARVGSAAPRFGGWDLSASKVLGLDKLRTQPAPAPLLITFGASWCTPCRAGLPRLKKLAARHPEMRLVLVVVESEPDKAHAWVKEVGLDGPVLLDKFEVVAKTYGLAGERTTLPRTFLLDAKGVVRAIYSVEGDDFEALIEADLKEALETARPAPEPKAK